MSFFHPPPTLEAIFANVELPVAEPGRRLEDRCSCGSSRDSTELEGVELSPSESPISRSLITQSPIEVPRTSGLLTSNVGPIPLLAQPQNAEIFHRPTIELALREIFGRGRPTARDRDPDIRRVNSWGPQRDPPKPIVRSHSTHAKGSLHYQDYNNDIDQPPHDELDYEVAGLGDFGTRFPLEIRWLIYSFLLSAHEVCRDEFHSSQDPVIAVYRKNGLSRRYAFDTSAFFICKAMYAEAKRYLYEQNTFVLVKYDMPHFIRELNCGDVPIVAHQGLSRDLADGASKEFSGWTLKINLRWIRFQNPTKETTSDVGHVLMLFEDMPVFCQWLKRICVNATPNRIYVQECPFRLRLWPTPDREGIPRTRAVLRKKGERPSYIRRLGQSRQRDFLEMLRPVIGIGYNFGTINFTNRALVRSIKRDTAPSIIWLRAFDQARMDEVLNEKRLELECANRCEPFAPSNHSTRHVIRLEQWMPIRFRFNRKIDPHRQHVIEVCNLVTADATLSSVELLLTLNMENVFDDFIASDMIEIDRLRLLTGNWLMGIYYYHVQAEVAITMMMASNNKTIGDLAALEHCVREIKTSDKWETEEYIAHDMPYFERFLMHVKMHGALPTVDDWYKYYKFNISPFRCVRAFNSTGTFPISLLPQRQYKSWQDVVAKESMSEELKQTCYKFAEQHKLGRPIF